jgi:hypothetical protein
MTDPSELEPLSDEEEQDEPKGGGAAEHQGEPTSALEENLRRKGRNSYYYAHQKRLGKGTFELQTKRLLPGSHAL